MPQCSPLYPGQHNGLIMQLKRPSSTPTHAVQNGGLLLDMGGSKGAAQAKLVSVPGVLFLIKSKYVYNY